MCCTSQRRADFPARVSQFNRWLATVLVLLSFSFLPLAAQEKDKGSGVIRGRVQNASNGSYLENVTVRIAGTSREALTNVSGEFEFRNVPAGEVSLEASYVGEPAQKATVTVAEGAAVTQDFTFRAAAGVVD